MYQILYHEKVVREDIPKLDGSSKRIIKEAIEVRLTMAPELYGKPLRRSLFGYRKLRVRDYRIIFKVQGSSVKVLIIAHRKVVYSQIAGRL